jgi:hypothetical protein
MGASYMPPPYCPNCDAHQSLWQSPLGQPADVKGYALDDQWYCCEGCAQGTGCTCQSAANTGD